MTPSEADESGTILVLTAMLLVVFLGVAALAIDAAAAWSTRRGSQAIADTSVIAALQALPKTMTISESHARSQAAADAFAAENAAANGISVGAVDLRYFPDGFGQVEIEINVSFTSNVTFGRAIGGPDEFSLGVQAAGRINARSPGSPEGGVGPLTMRLFPLGIPRGSRGMYCSVSQPSGTSCPAGSPSQRVQVIAMRRSHSTPNCQDATETTEDNLRLGVDHLIGFDSELRSEQLACHDVRKLPDGHNVSLPTTSQTITTGNASGTVQNRVPFQSAFAPLLTGPPLWGHLRDGLGGTVCDPAVIEAGLDIEIQTQLMSECLIRAPQALWPLFDTDNGLTRTHPRLGWGVFTQSGGDGVVYSRAADNNLDIPVFWVHSTFNSSGQSTSNAGSADGVVVFHLHPGMLPAGFTGGSAIGPEGIEYLLTG